MVSTGGLDVTSVKETSGNDCGGGEGGSTLTMAAQDERQMG